MFLDLVRHHYTRESGPNSQDFDSSVRRAVDRSIGNAVFRLACEAGASSTLAMRHFEDCHIVDQTASKKDCAQL